MSTLLLFCLLMPLQKGGENDPADIFTQGQSISLDGILPANERGILCLSVDEQGRILGGTTGRAAHLFLHDPATGKTRSLAQLPGGIGFSHALVRLADGTFIVGTQADPTGIAPATDAKAVGKLYRLTLKDERATLTELGVPVAGQGIYTLAYLEKSQEVVGLTWPEGHFFVWEVKTGKFTDHGSIAGHRTFETPRHAELINKGSGQQVRYPRQVSRAIAIDPRGAAYTGGANGYLYRYNPQTKKISRTDTRLPSVRGREPWCSLDAVAVVGRTNRELGEYVSVVGGTSDGHLFELRLYPDQVQLRARGKPLAAPGIQGLTLVDAKRPRGEDQARFQVVYGFGGRLGGLTRGLVFRQGGSMSAVLPGGIPLVDGQPAMETFAALTLDGKGNLWAGEAGRLGRLVRFPLEARDSTRPSRQTPARPQTPAKVEFNPPVVEGRVVFAPEGTTTDASGYTAIEVGKDGKVYVGAARYGDYAWLLRFDPAKKPLWMERVVNLRELTGERRQGINTQGKIHAKILVASDGKVWFASKQAHEVFGTRPEYAEDPDGYPGGHLFWFDPKTGFSRSQGILMPQEGLMAGALDERRGRLYYRSEPRNHFLVYDIKTGAVRDRGDVGAQGRYMATDAKGRVYLPGRGRTLCRYDPVTDLVEDLQVQVKDDRGYATPYVLLAGPDAKLYGVGTQHPWILEYDLAGVKDEAFPKVPVRNVAPTAPQGLPTLDIHSAVFGQDGRLYYPLATSRGDPRRRGERFLVLMRFDPRSGKTETVGVPKIVGLDESKVKQAYVRGDKYAFDHTQGAAVGPDGSLYVLDIYPQLNVVCFPRLTAPR